MDVVRESFSGVEEAERLIRSLNSELNALRDNAARLARAAGQIPGVEPSSVSGSEMETLFTDAADAARGLESSAREVGGYVSDAREAVGDLGSALRSGSDTPIIGGTLGSFAQTASRFESELSGLSDLLEGFESELGALADDLDEARDSANDTFQNDVNRWLSEPHDTEWPPADPERRPTGLALQPTAAPAPAPMPTSVATDTAAPTPAPDRNRIPFQLAWGLSETSVQVGESFMLAVHMYDLREDGDHGGISVSFPTVTESGGSTQRYSSSIADVEAVEYTGDLSNVAFHQPGATIYHRQDNRQFAAQYLLVESDDPSWSRASGRTLRLRITPKQAGEFQIQIRGWLCADGYTGCARNPSEGAATDQQGHVVEQVSVSVTTTPAAAPTPTPALAPVDDHGNSPQDATAIVANAPHSGNIERRGDVDFFSFPASGAGPHVVGTQAGTLSDTVITIYGPGGALIGTDDGGSGETSRYEFTPSSLGTYYAAVGGYDSETGTYRLTIEVDESAASPPAPAAGRIAFHSLRDGNSEIYVMNADGSAQTRLTHNRVDDWRSSWSPDGRRIAFTSDRDGNAEIYVMNADGTGQTRLTHNEADDGWPSWSPD